MRVAIARGKHPEGKSSEEKNRLRKTAGTPQLRIPAAVYVNGQWPDSLKSDGNLQNACPIT